MTLYRLLMLIGITALTAAGCFQNDCETWIDQPFQIPALEASLGVQQDTVRVGDTLPFELLVPRQLADESGTLREVDGGFRIMVRFSHLPSTSPGGEDFFTTDTTLSQVFDEHFGLQIEAGRRDTALTFFFDATQVGDAWAVRLRYLPKQAGNYRVGVGLYELKIEPEGLGSEDCIKGSEVWGSRVVWAPNPHNAIRQFYDSTAHDLSGDFALIIRE